VTPPPSPFTELVLEGYWALGFILLMFAVIRTHVPTIRSFTACFVVSFLAAACAGQREFADSSLFSTPLSPEADAFLTMCNEEYNQKQKELHERYLSDVERYDADLERGVVTFRKKSGRILEFDVQVVGSVNRSDQEWEWAWNNPNVAAELSRASAGAKAIGEKYGIRYLTEGFVPVPEKAFPSYLSGITLKTSGAVGVYSAEYGDLELYWLLSNPREH
jgi:hypothetical protein